MSKRYAIPFLLLSATQAMAAPDNQRYEWSLGLGVAGGSSIYQGVEDQAVLAPLFNITYGDFFLEGLTAGYSFINQERYTVSLLLNGDTLSGERTDGELLDDMGDVDLGINLGIEGEMFTPIGLLSARISQDIADEHDGVEVELAWGAPIETDNAFFLPSVYAIWMDEKLVNHYYGVPANKVTASRQRYEADAEWRYGVSLMVEYPLTQQWSVMGGVNAEWFGKEVTDSPIVEEDSTVNGMLAVQYYFKPY